MYDLEKSSFDDRDEESNIIYGKVVTQGAPGACTDTITEMEQLNEISEICSNRMAFSAIKKNGTVVTWGDPKFGGNQHQLTSKLTEIKHIYATSCAFAAVRKNGTLVT